MDACVSVGKGASIHTAATTNATSMAVVVSRRLRRPVPDPTLMGQLEEVSSVCTICGDPLRPGEKHRHRASGFSLTYAFFIQDAIQFFSSYA